MAALFGLPTIMVVLLALTAGLVGTLRFPVWVRWVLLGAAISRGCNGHGSDLAGDRDVGTLQRPDGRSRPVVVLRRRLR